MAQILRNPAKAAEPTYDLIIIGGGIYGVMLSLESSCRGLRSLLIERDDFGGATSFNSLRILHGGLRYLQDLDLQRFFESVAERRWFLQTFPHLVEVLPCMMPLYGDGLRRPSVLRLALWLNDLLSWRRNQGVRYERHLPAGKVIDPATTRKIFPAADMQGLQGSVVWYDAIMPDSQRVLIDSLRWSCGCGATALNYVEAQALLQTSGSAAGVVAYDWETKTHYHYKSRVVVNAAGPWCRELATRFDQDVPQLFKPTLAWNVLLNRDPVSTHALALTCKKGGGPTYFVVPWKGKILVGTRHEPVLGPVTATEPSKHTVRRFLGELNDMLPALGVGEKDIIHIFSGLAPATEVGGTEFACREKIYDHGKLNGPHGLYSISGVKFTTARLVAHKTLNRVFPERSISEVSKQRMFGPPQDVLKTRGLVDIQRLPQVDDTHWRNELSSLIAEESVQHLDDLIFRRTNLWEHATIAQELAPMISELLPWVQSRRCEEIDRVLRKLDNGNKMRRP
jgi:glycerol-3-phosphate dehydrogenase